MKIEYKPDEGPPCTAAEPAGRPGYVVVSGASCPTCARRVRFVLDGRTVALVLPEDLVRARLEYPRAAEYSDDGAFRVCVPYPTHDSHTSHGRASCVRCGRSHGAVTVSFHTLFGTEEDTAVLGGRARVY